MKELYFCKRCNKPVFENFGSGQFCSRKCANSRLGANKISFKTIPIHDSKGNKLCLNCGRKITGEKYCNAKCQQNHQQKLFEDEWLSGKLSITSDNWNTTNQRIRKYLFRKYENKCAICGWSEVNPFTSTIPLEVEHIDGDPYNDSPDNLTLLCPNCHSLTKTYRGANIGHGRKKKWIPI